MLKPLKQADASRLRDFLESSDYTDPGFRNRPELGELPSKRTGNLPFLLEVTSEPCAQNTLIRLFLFGLSLERVIVEAAVRADIFAIMIEACLLVPEGGRFRPMAMLAPVGPQILASDPVWKMDSEQAADVVVWPNQTTRMLQAFSIRRHAAKTLDLGSGCGVISMLAAGWSDRVVATDLNPRAAEFTAFNAALNGVDNVEILTGDTFEPVAGIDFDQVLANPPFFVTPSSGQLYCENPMELDGYCRRVVREGAEHLREGGFLQMVCEWVQLEGQSWQDRLAEWVEGLGCDAWIVRTYAGGVAAYAVQRIKSNYPSSMEASGLRFEECLTYYRKLGVDQVHGGVLALRKRAGSNWLRIEENQLDVTEPFGGQVLDVFANQDILSAADSDARLLVSRPRLAHGARLDQRLECEDGQWRSVSMKISASGALPSSLAIEPQVADFVALCNGTQTVEEMVRDLAERVKAPIGMVRPQVCAAIRKAAERRIVLL